MPRVNTGRSTKRTTTPNADEIARRAYERFVARGREHGHDLEDWLQAESELLRERAVRRPTRGD